MKEGCSPPLIVLLWLSSVSAGGAPGLWERAVQAEGALWGGDASLQGGAGQNIGGDGGETPGHDWGGPAGEGGGEETPCDSRCTGLWQAEKKSMPPYQPRHILPSLYLFYGKKYIFLFVFVYFRSACGDLKWLCVCVYKQVKVILHVSS